MATSIAGLPPGAIVTAPNSGAQPAPAVDHSTLPPGALLTTPGAQPQASPSNATEQQPPVDDSYLSGVWENTLGPLYEKFKADYKESQRIADEPFLQSLQDNVKRAVTENPGLGGGLKMLWSVAQDAYAEGKKSVGSLKDAATNASLGRGKDAALDFMEAQGHGVAALLPVLGPMAAQAGEHLGGGQPKRGLGNMTGIALNLLLGKATEKVGGRIMRGGGAATMDEATAARKLVDAVNPPPATRDVLEANLQRELPRIKQYAEKAGIDLADRDGLIQTAQRAGEEYQALYDKQLLEPISNKVASNGKTFLENEQELRRLNQMSDYTPNTKAETAAQIEIKAEAAKLRTMMNNDMARALGNDITPEQISETRSIGESMRAIGREARMAKNVEAHATNAQARGGVANVHATPHGAYVTGGGRVGAAANRFANRVLGHPGDNLVKEVFEKYQPDTGGLRRAPNGDIIEAPSKANPKAPVPNVQDAEAAAAERKFATRKERPIPPAGEIKSPGSTATIGDQLKAKDQAAAARAQERGASVKATRQSRSQAALDQMEKNRATHGKYKSAVRGMEE